MRLPPVFSKSFYRLLAEFAEEFAVTRGEFAIRALKCYAKQLRAKETPVTSVLDNQSLEDYGKVQSALAKKYWKTVSPDERKKRAAKALAARWGTKKK